MVGAFVRRILSWISRIVLLLGLSVILTGWLAPPALASAAKSKPQVVHTHPGKPWRIGYVQSTNFVNYAGTLDGLVHGLTSLGWITNTAGLPYQTNQVDSQVMWHWLATHNTGPNIQFVSDAFYSLDTGANVQAQVLQRIAKRKDLDLLIVMGTTAGQAMSTGQIHIPVMVFSVTDAIAAGIVKSASNSGKPDVWADLDPGRYQRQIAVFHDIFPFKRLGMVYQNTAALRTKDAVPNVETAAKRMHFTILPQFVNEPTNPADPAQVATYYRQMAAAYRQLAPKVDAFYLTAGQWDEAHLASLLQPFYAHKIPIFSQIGTDDVQHGALMSLYRASFDGVGQFGAEQIIKALSGVPLEKLPQVYVDTPSIVINLAVAQKIEWKPQFDILLSADKIFTSIARTNA